MPLPEQSRYTTNRGRAPRVARPTQMGDGAGWTPTSRVPGSGPPKPYRDTRNGSGGGGGSRGGGPVRYTTPADPMPLPDAPEDHNLERTINRLPFFAEYEKRIHFPSGVTNVTSTVPELMNLTGQGALMFKFEKYETWTDVIVRIDLSGRVTGGADILVTTKVVFRDQNGKDWDSDIVGRFNYDEADVGHFWCGRRRVANLPPGEYTVRPFWWVSSNTFRFGQSNTITITATEVVPIPGE